MAELVFILTEFFSAAGAGGQGSDANAGADLPRLPLLETIFARASAAALVPDWRGWLTARAAADGMPAATPDATIAQTVATAWGTRAPAQQSHGQVWLATPVHYFAGIDSLYLHPAGLLQLERAEQDTLVADFARVFAGSPWALRSIGRRELLLSGPVIAASGSDPAQFAGSDPFEGLARGTGAAALRGLGAEIEMWLYEHPLNLERHSRGELPVTTLWPWGAQHNPGAPPVVSTHAHRQMQAARLYGRDTYAEALWRLAGGEAQALPASLDAAPAAAGADDIFLYPLLQPQGLSAALLQFEQRWLPGALRALRQRRIAALRLVVGQRAYALHWLSLARWWRERRPWWETLA